MDETWRGLWVVAYREVLRFLADRGRMVSSFAMPLLFLVIFGAGFSKTIGALAPGVNYIQFMFPGIVAMTVLMNSLFSGISVVADKEFGFLREILVAPISRIGIVLGKAVGGSAIALIQALVLLVLAPVVGVALSARLLLELAPVVIVLALGLSCLGILIAAFMESQQGFQLIVQVIIFPLIFLAGVFFPTNNVPGWMAFISKINPLTYGVDAIRQIFLGSSRGLGVSVFGHVMTLSQEALLITAFAAVLLVAAGAAFDRRT